MEQRVEQMTWKINFKVSIIVVVLVFSSQVSFSFSSVPWSFFLCWSVFTYSLQFLIFLQWHSWTINQGSEWVNIETQQAKHDSFSQEGILYIFFCIPSSCKCNLNLHLVCTEPSNRESDQAPTSQGKHPVRSQGAAKCMDHGFDILFSVL